MSSFDEWLGLDIPDNVMSEASQWMATLDSPERTPEDSEGFSEWLAADPVHRVAFEELSEVWARLHTLSDVNQLAEDPDVIPFPALSAKRPSDEFNAAPPRRRRDWSSAAAAILVGVAVIINFLANAPVDVHTTSTGETLELSLSDGSRIELNARTSVEVQLDDRRRRIELLDGEAVFSVAEDARPFIVSTALGSVSAVGTEFFVRSSPALLEVAVIDGLVSVSPSLTASDLTNYQSQAMLRFNDELALLGPGQSLELTRESQRFLTKTDRMIDDALSWRNGEIVFSETPLVSAIAQIRRHVDAPIFVGDPVLNSLRISGRFPTDDVQPFLDQLGRKYGIVTDRSHDRMVILRLRSELNQTHP